MGKRKILQQTVQGIGVNSVVGIDGCKSGWVTTSNRDGQWSVNIFKSISEIHTFFDEALYLIDIPIGLPDRHLTRTVDARLRKILSPVRHHSVFTPPCREAIVKDDYRQALEVNRRITNKGISIQSWNIVPKIMEVDLFLRSHERLIDNFRESHPELCFYALNGSHMVGSKHTKEGLDSMVLAVSAMLGKAQGFEILEGDPLYDSEQLPIRLVYFKA